MARKAKKPKPVRPGILNGHEEMLVRLSPLPLRIKRHILATIRGRRK